MAIRSHREGTDRALQDSSSSASEASQGVPVTILRAAVPQSIAQALPLTRLLSERERAVFRLLGAGHDNRSIASNLGVSESTVKRHVSVILAKLRLESRLQAGLAALIASCSAPNGTP